MKCLAKGRHDPSPPRRMGFVAPRFVHIRDHNPLLPTDHTVPYGTGFWVGTFQAFHAWLPSVSLDGTKSRRVIFGRRRLAGPPRLRFYPSQADIFDGHVIIQTVFRAFPAISGFFYSAERRHHVRDQPGIYADHAKFQSFSDAPDSTNVAAVEIARSDVRRAVGQLDCLTLLFK